MSATYLYVFLQSNLLEVPFYFWLLRRKESWVEFLVWVTLINSLTHPIVFFVIMNLKLTYLQNILIAESFAVLSEALFFWWLLGRSAQRSFLASLVANLVSWQLAPIMTYAFFG